MEIAPNHPLLQVTQEEIKKARTLLNINKEKITTNLAAIKKWIEKEEHLAKSFKYLGNDVLEQLHILEKGSVERTKLRIDRYLTTRGMVPELCLNKTIDEFDDLLRDLMLVPLPKLHPSDLSRITVLKLANEKANDLELLPYMRFVLLLLDYKLKFDYALGERHLVDLKHFNLTGLSKLNPFLFKKAEVVCMEGYGLRVKGIHIVNGPPFLEKLVSLLRKVLREKVARRIFVHNTLEDLYKEIPKEVLSEEYGGDLISCSALSEQWKSTLKSEEGRKFIENANKLVSDNSKRSSYEFNAEYLGTPGSFSQLVVD